MDGAVDCNADGDDCDHDGTGVQRDLEDLHYADDHQYGHHAGHQRNDPALDRGEHQRHHDEHHRQQSAKRRRLPLKQPVGCGIDHEVLADHDCGHVGAGVMSDHFLQLADMVVQRGGVAHVVPDHDVGATVIVADIGFEVARRMQQQVLGDQLAGPRHPVGFRPAPTRLLVGLGHHIGQRQAPVEYLLLGDE